MKRSMRRFAGVAVLLLGCGVLAGCTGGSDESSPKTSTTAGGEAGGSSSTALAAAAKQVTEQYLNAPEPTVVASVKGTIRGTLDTDNTTKDVPGTLAILAVQAGPRSTVVRWRLASDQPMSGVSTNYYNNLENRLPDTDAVALAAQQINVLSLSGIWSGEGPSSRDCTCAYVPHELGPTGVELSNLYPALPSTVTEIELRVPGFPALKAPVTRN